MLLLEILALLLLSSFINSPITFGYLFGAYIASKIARSWFRGCLPSGGGGGLLSGGDDGEFDSSDHPEDYEGERRRRAAANSQVGPTIRLIPLGSDASAVLERVMAEENCGDRDQTTSVEAQREVSSKIEKMAPSAQPPKLKKQFQKERQNPKNHPDSELKEASNPDIVEDDSPKNDETGIGNESMSIDGSDNQLDNTNDGGNVEFNPPNAIEKMVENSIMSYSLDCYPYTFSPLLLFTNGGYFDKGYSNYNAVAAFFAPALRGLGGGARDEVGDREKDRRRRRRTQSRGNKSEEGEKEDDSDANGEMAEEEEDEYEDSIDMLHGVVYDRKNLTYDELFTHITNTNALVTCCIDAHFTAFQMLNKNTLMYYDPLQPSLHIAKGERDVHNVALYLLMKCHYGDNGHVQDNKKHYTGPSSSRLQNAV